MAEQFNNHVQVGVKFIRCSLEPILSQDIIAVRTQNLCDGEFAQLKVDKVLETCLSL
jgi:hypothetical protein